MRRAGLGGAAMLAMLAVSGCGGGTAHAVRYTGALPGCGLAAATLTRQGKNFAFAPSDGVLTILGTVGSDGSFAGTLNTQPPGKPAFVLSVHGTVGRPNATIDYTTPRCHAQATLSRVEEPRL